MTEFIKSTKEHFKKLDLYVPVVDKVHGGTHPEFHDVRRLYEAINEKSDAAGMEKPNLNNELTALREVTNNYSVPEDVCESYEAVYSMLAEIDAAYEK